MKDIILLGKRVISEKSPVLLAYKPDKDWEKYWEAKGGSWKEENGALIGFERGNKGGILLSRESFDDNVMISFTAATVLPATRDVNAVFCAEWDESIDYLGESYVCGLNGWYDGKSGIERNPTANPNSHLNATTTLYKYIPGREVRLCAGAIDGHCFMTVDDVLVSELIDTNPIKGGHVGFSPYCTMLKIKDITIQKIYYENIQQEYEPEF